MTTRRVRVWVAATGETSKTAPRAMQPRTKWIVTVFIGLLLVGCRSPSQYRRPGPSQGNTTRFNRGRREQKWGAGVLEQWCFADSIPPILHHSNSAPFVSLCLRCSIRFLWLNLHGRQNVRKIELRITQMPRMFEQQSNRATKKEKSEELYSLVSSLFNPSLCPMRLLAQ